VTIAGEGRNAEEAVELARGMQPDLLFLDIEMPGGSGFDVLDRLDDVPQVIFTTAFDAYAIRAFEVNALDYLLKPIAPERLAEALRRVAPALHPSPATRLEQVFVRDGERCWIVKVRDIGLFESEGNYTRLYFGAERPLIRCSLNALEQQLDPALFFRANRQQIINLEWIERTVLSVAGGLTVSLRGGRTVEMSRRQSDKLREVLSL
jgi:two-component system LytT family response regulator